VGKIQERYGVAKDRAEDQLSAWEKEREKKREQEHVEAPAVR
jgi:hypothetical protein